MSIQPILRASIVLATVLAAACGGGGGGNSTGGDPPQPPQPPSGIGPMGGTVTGPSGARVVIPAGALAASTTVRIERSSQGAPPLPTGATSIGPMFAFMPHGTQFAAPVTITVPYDDAAAGGATPVLYKTNARDEWETVMGATFAAGLATAEIAGFSWLQIAAPPPLASNEPHRWWQFFHYAGDGSLTLIDDGGQAGGELEKLIDLGPSRLLTMELEMLHATRPPGHIAQGYVFGTSNGYTYGAFAEAPDGWAGARVVPSGGKTFFEQNQSFIKRQDDARLSYTVTAVTIIAQDFIVPLFKPATFFGEVEFFIQANKGKGGTTAESFYYVGGSAEVRREGHLQFGSDAGTSAISRHKLWEPGDFDFSVEDVHVVFDPAISTQSCDGVRAVLRLRRPITLSVDLSTIGVDEEFTVYSTVIADAKSHGSGPDSYCRTSYVGTFMRDPAEIGGAVMEFDGLEPTNRPLRLESAPQLPLPDPIECASTNPLAEAGVIELEAPSFVVDESPSRPARVAVTRAGGATGRVSAYLRTEDATATSGIDYAATYTIVYFDDGEAGRRLVDVPVHGDEIAEGDETVRLTLSEPGGCAALGAQMTAMLTIRDDDGATDPLSFTVGGSVGGLVGSGLELLEVITGSRVTPAADGAYTFPYDFPQGTAYDVRVAAQPASPIQTCTVNNAIGTVGAAADVTDVNVVCTTHAPPGGVDLGFGSNGRVTAGLAGGAKAIALQSDGKIVALGDLRVARYNADGSLDPTFGTAGEASFVFADVGFNDDATDLAVQNDGKMLVAGVSRPGGIGSTNDFAVARFNADGTLDTSFGTDGKAYVDFLTGHDQANAVLVQPDGRILVIGHARVPSTSGIDNDFAVARLTSTGAPDASFGTAGRVTVDVAGNVDRANAAALQADGAIVIAGDVRADGGDPTDVGVIRLASDGTLDATFGSGGVVRINYALGLTSASAADDSAADVAIQLDGRIVIAGHAVVGSTRDFMIARLNADGSRDGSFGTDGLVTTPFGTLQDFATAVAVQQDGAIVAAGSASSANVTDFGLVRVRGDGTFDLSFGGGGALVIDYFGAADAANALALQPDGKIVAAGVARNGTTDGVGIARVMP